MVRLAALRGIDGAGEVESAVMLAGGYTRHGQMGQKVPIKGNCRLKMSQMLKWVLVALAIFGVLWFLQSRVGPEDMARQEIAVDANAIR